ncbi:MAG: type III pantothenate kinase [Gammaproteobacteria bacterium]|nr:MAG: type III pantothenate kinase [Gammaproteobacteria bacterium]
MILDIDAGNTFIKWRLSDGRRGRLLTADLTDAGVRDWGSGLDQVRVASVAGEPVNQTIKQYCNRFGLPMPRFARTKAVAAGVTNSYTNPSRMGVDRWLAMLAAYNDAHAECCVVDCGSAITVDYISATGEHLGGYIIPGLRLMQRGLLSNTAEILVDQAVEGFDILPGKHTSAAVMHGINFTFQALVEKIIKDTGGCHLYITGGDGELFHHLAGGGRLIPDLVLDGLPWGIEN